MLVKFKGNGCENCPLYSRDGTMDDWNYCTIGNSNYALRDEVFSKQVVFEPVVPDIDRVDESGFPENCPFKNGERVEIVALDA